MKTRVLVRRRTLERLECVRTIQAKNFPARRYPPKFFSRYSAKISSSLSPSFSSSSSSSFLPVWRTGERERKRKKKEKKDGVGKLAARDVPKQWSFRAILARVFHLQATGPAIRFLYNWRSSNEMRLPTRIFFFLPFFRLHETNEFAVSDRILRSPPRERLGEKR